MADLIYLRDALTNNEWIPVRRTDDFTDKEWEELVQKARAQGVEMGQKGTVQGEDLVEGNPLPKSKEGMGESAPKPFGFMTKAARDASNKADEEKMNDTSDSDLGTVRHMDGKTVVIDGSGNTHEIQRDEVPALLKVGFRWVNDEAQRSRRMTGDSAELSVMPTEEKRRVRGDVELSAMPVEKRPDDISVEDVVVKPGGERARETAEASAGRGDHVPGPFGFLARALQGAAVREVPGGTPNNSEAGLPPANQTRIYGPGTPPGGIGAGETQLVLGDQRPDAGDQGPPAPEPQSSGAPTGDWGYKPSVPGPEVMEPPQMPSQDQLAQIQDAQVPMEYRASPPGQSATGMPATQNPAVVDPQSLPQDMRPQPANRVDPARLVGGMTAPTGPGGGPMPGEGRTGGFSFSGSPGSDAGPEDAEMAAAYKQRAQAAEAMAAAQEREQTAKAGIIQKQIASAADNQAQILAAQQHMHDQMNDMMTRYQDAVSHLGDVAKIDPDRWWNSRTTGQRIFAMVGMALSSIGDGENQVMTMIQQAVKNDIESQIANANNQRDSLKAQTEGFQTMYGMFRQAGLDEVESKKAATAYALEQTQREVEMLAARTGSDTAKATAQNLIGQLNGEKLKEIDALKNHRAQRAYTTLKMQAAMQGKSPKQIKDTLADKLGQLKAAIGMSKNLESSFKTKSVAFLSKLTAYVPRSDAAQYNAERDLALRVIGKMVDESVLMKNDAEQWERLLPRAGDTNGAQKLRVLNQVIARQYNERIKALRGAGYGTGSVDEVTDQGDDEELGFQEDGYAHGGVVGLRPEDTRSSDDDADDLDWNIDPPDGDGDDGNEPDEEKPAKGYSRGGAIYSSTTGGRRAGQGPLYADGGRIPGRAKTRGDAVENDTVHARLSPGEIVIPRSHSRDPEKAKEFIELLFRRMK